MHFTDRHSHTGEQLAHSHIFWVWIQHRQVVCFKLAKENALLARSERHFIILPARELASMPRWTEEKKAKSGHKRETEVLLKSRFGVRPYLVCKKKKFAACFGPKSCRVRELEHGPEFFAAPKCFGLSFFASIRVLFRRPRRSFILRLR